MDAEIRAFRVEPQTFQEDVVERSKQIPVVLLFWTDQVPPAVETKRLLESLVEQYQGKFVLGHSDVAVEPAVAQQLRVQSIPSIRLLRDGQILDQLDGPQGERALRDFLDKHTLSSGEKLQSMLADMIGREDWDAAAALLQQALNEEPNNPVFKVEWADVLVRRGDLNGARQVLSTIDDEVVEKIRPETRLAIAEETADIGSIKKIVREIEKDPDNLEVRYQYALLLAQKGEYELALENALVILQTDREFREDLGRQTMVRIMSLLEKDSPIAKKFRRRMFSFMH